MNPNPRHLHLATLFLRLALAVSYISAVADRFGLWGAAGTGSVAWGSFDAFQKYTGQVLSFLPAALVPAASWAATIGEILLAIGLLAGYQLRWVGLGSALMLFSFAASMTLSFGAEAALSYSVWTACAASLLITVLHADGSTKSSASKSHP